MTEISERYLDNEISLLQDLFQSMYYDLKEYQLNLTDIIRVRWDSNFES